LLGEDFHDPPALAFIAPGDNHDLIVLFDFDSICHTLPLQIADFGLQQSFLNPPAAFRHQITSGARLTIFIKPFSRSSLATGPKTRVPTGSPSGLIKTAAF